MHEPYERCDDCQAELSGEVWLTLDGTQRCRECALAASGLSVRTATKPEARDDGR